MNEDQTIVVEVRGPQRSGATSLAELLSILLGSEGLALPVHYEDSRSKRDPFKVASDVRSTGSRIEVREADDTHLDRELTGLRMEVGRLRQTNAELAKGAVELDNRRRTLLGHYNNLVLRYDELQQAGERLAEDHQVQVDALLARVADLESQLVEQKTRHDVETEQLRALSARLEEIQPKVDELAARYGRLLAAFHDATRRALGVVPLSGEEFYDSNMADEAEARAVRYGRGRR